MLLIFMLFFLRANSGPEAFVGGLVGWVIVMVFIALFKHANKAIKGKKFNEIKNDNP